MVHDTTNQPEPNELEEFTSCLIRDRGAKGEWVRELLVASIQRGAWSSEPHGRRLQVVTFPKGAEELAPENAGRLAEEPTVILVENRNSDGVFVERVVAALDRALNALWQRPGRPIRIDSLGGAGEMAAEIERRTRDLPYRPRLVAIGDSDRKGPNDDESGAARRLRRTCGTLGVGCWILAKREADNYLPRVLLVERPNAGIDHTRLVEAWDGLNDDQKDFFDMKNGLPEMLSETEQALFEGLSAAARNILSRGFGSNLHACWSIWNVQAGSELRRRGRGDLEDGIKLIQKEV